MSIFQALRLGGALLLLVVCNDLVAPRFVAGWNEPNGFRDIPWGVNEEWLRKKQDIHPNRCLSTPPDLGDRLCPDGFLVGGVEVMASFIFRADALVEVALTFKSNEFPLMEAIFIERYGRPTATRQELLKTGAGGEYINNVLEWAGFRAYVTLARYGSKITESSAVLQTAAQRAEKIKRTLERAKKGAGEL